MRICIALLVTIIAVAIFLVLFEYYFQNDSNARNLNGTLKLARSIQRDYISRLEKRLEANYHKKENPDLLDINSISPILHLAVPINLCDEEPYPNILVFIISNAYNVVQRQAIRETFANKNLTRISGVKVIFVIGQINQKLKFLQNIESRQGDIFSFPVQENKISSTVKAIGVLRIVSVYCQTPRFLFITHDASVINLINLNNFVNTIQPSESKIYGRKVSGFRPYRSNNTRWSINKEAYGLEVFPDFILDSYLMRTEIAKRLYLTLLRSLPVIYLQDVLITGILAEKLKITRVDLNYFKQVNNTFSNWSDEYNHSIYLGPYIETTKLLDYWANKRPKNN